MFQTLGPAIEKARSPSLVRERCTAAVPLVVDLKGRVDDYMTGRGTVNIAIRQLGDALFWHTA